MKKKNKKKITVSKRNHYVEAQLKGEIQFKESSQRPERKYSRRVKHRKDYNEKS